MRSVILHELGSTLAVKEASTAGKTHLERLKFALTIPLIDAAILPEHAKACDGCHLPFNPKFEVAGPNMGHETAAMFPCCKSIIGFHCARDWVMGSGFAFCPYCEKHFETITGFVWHVSTWEELLESGMATLVVQSRVCTDAPEEDASYSFCIDKGPEASLSDAETQGTISQQGSPTILVTDAEGRTSAGTQADVGRHISNADTAGMFGEANGKTLAKKSEGPKFKGWSLALAAAKVATWSRH